MPQQVTEVLALINDIVQAAIVVFGIAVLLFNLRHMFRDRVTRAFSSLLFFVIIVYFTELLVTRATFPLSTANWIRLEWIGIAMVPAALFHLADAILITTGDISVARRRLVRIWYIVGILFFCLALFSNLLVGKLLPIGQAPHLSGNLLFPLFVVYYWTISLLSVYLIWRARERCLTKTTRKRISVILASALAAPLAVFPYLTLNDDPTLELSIFFWLVIVAGNVVVSVMFAFMTYYIAYFGASSPDRVVRVRLFKFMARVPLAATIVLITYVIVGRADTILGLPGETALAIAIVGAIILVEWAFDYFKKPLERLFQLTDEPEVRRIQQLSERVLTTRDMRQFLESVLAASCEVLRTPTAFLAAITPQGPRLEAVVGPLNLYDEEWAEEELQELAETAVAPHIQPSELEANSGFFIWRDFWIRTLYKENQSEMVGILGIRARARAPDLNELEEETFEKLTEQAAHALEDRLLQQEVFAAVEGLLPQVTALQMRRSAATFGGAPALTSSDFGENNLLNDPQFNTMVWDALSHYWGGPKLTESPLLGLQVVRESMDEHGNNPSRALRHILARAVEQQRPEGERSMTTTEWILYNILELKFIQGRKVRDVARRLAMSESDLYRKQRVAIENVARTVYSMEEEVASVPENEDEAQEVNTIQQ